jgi:hypothetical protein
MSAHGTLPTKKNPTSSRTHSPSHDNTLIQWTQSRTGSNPITSGRTGTNATGCRKRARLWYNRGSEEAGGQASPMSTRGREETWLRSAAVPGTGFKWEPARSPPTLPVPALKLLHLTSVLPSGPEYPCRAWARFRFPT